MLPSLTPSQIVRHNQCGWTNGERPLICQQLVLLVLSWLCSWGTIGGSCLQPTQSHSPHTASLLVSLDMHGQSVRTRSLVCLCGVADGFCLWPLVRSSDACAAGLLLALQPLDHPTKRAHSRIASSLSLSHRSVHSRVIVCGVAGLVAVWLSENYHSRLHTSTQPCYRTPSPIQTCMARTHTHTTLALVSQCHHPCYHTCL
jgi:hypothetical protein